MMGTGRSFNTDCATYVGGVKYRFTTNTEKGGYFHRHYKSLVKEGLPIVFLDTAYNERGEQLGDNYLAVFVAESSRDLVRQALKKATSSKLEHARFDADLGQPTSTLELLLESEADEATQRDVLATAYEKSAARRHWIGNYLGMKQYHEDAKRDWRFAKKIRDGKVKITLLPEDQQRGL